MKKMYFVEEVFGNWGEEKSVWSEFENAEQAKAYYLQACEDYDVAVKLYSDNGDGKQLLEQTDADFEN